MKSILVAVFSVTLAIVTLLGVSLAGPTPSGLVGRWTADGTADDTVGANNGALLNGATFTTGVLGQAFLFDGVDDYFQAPTVGFPTGSSDRTLTLWVKIDTAVTTEAFFGGFGNFGEFTHTYALGSRLSTSRLFFSQWGSDVNGPQLENGRWYHAAVTNTGNQVTLYLDGNAVSGVVTIATSQDSQFYLGRIPGSNGNIRRLQGAVDDVRIYNRALSADEIMHVFNERATKSPFDFDGDGKTDIGIFRPVGATAEWWINRSSTGETFALQFGSSTDRITPADYTGDGKTDIAFFRPSSGEWYVLRSEDFSFFALPFGTNGDIPAPADYDADGKADFAVFRPSSGIWFISQSAGGGTRIFQFGIAGDVPVVADYDSDGKADVAIFRPGPREWWIDRSTAGLLAMQFGSSGDKAVQGDYTGDGKSDVAIWRPTTGEWFVVRSEDFSFYGFPFGTNGDIVAPGDYDGDGKFDVAVFRPSSATWFISRTTAGTQIVQFGASGDLPLPSAFVP